MPQTSTPFRIPVSPFFAAFQHLLRIGLLLCGVLFGTAVRAGDQNAAYFTLTEYETNVEVLAEIPRTASARLASYNPRHPYSAATDTWAENVERSLREQLILRGTDGALLPLERMDRVGSDGQYASYRLVYTGSGLAQVRNTVLCDRHPDQVNHHFLSGNVAEKTFTTSTERPAVRFAGPEVEDYRWMGLLLFPFLYLFWPMALRVLD
ncbi:MAG: hypothetical protein WA952_10710 [Lewinella sp.]